MNAELIQVGVIADTHGLFRPGIRAAFSGVSLIVHAGNIDDRHDPMLPRSRTLPVGDLTLHLSHGDELGSPQADALLAAYDADIIVYGHTHRALELRGHDGRLVVNPGAAGPRRFNLPSTVALLTIDGRHARVRFLDVT